jgi:hypothetical protein
MDARLSNEVVANHLASPFRPQSGVNARPDIDVPFLGAGATVLGVLCRREASDGVVEVEAVSGRGRNDIVRSEKCRICPCESPTRR